MVNLLSALLLASGTTLAGTAAAAGAAGKPDDLVIAAFGGYGSCGYGERDHPVAKGAQELAATLAARRQVQARLVLSCFGGTVGDPDVAGEGSMDVATLTRLVANLTQATTQKRLIIIGHSHGGWLAMQVVHALPREVKIAFLVTVDPISRDRCSPVHFAGTVAAKTIGDPHRQDCERFPADIDIDFQSHLAGRTLGWLHFYQTQTEDLHSSGTAFAHRSKRLDFTEAETNGQMVHAYIAGAPVVWKAVIDTVLADAAVPMQPDPSLIPGTATGSPLFALPDAYRSWHALARYRKAAVTFWPRRGDKNRAVVFQPNVEPVAGGEVDVSANLGFEYDQSLPFLRTRSPALGRTKAFAFDFHYLSEHWGVDLYLHDYRSLFRFDVDRKDVRPFRDALFGGVDHPMVFPEMHLRGAGLDGVYTLWPDRFSNLAAMSPSVLPLRGGWSPVGVASMRYEVLTNQGPMLPGGFTGDPAFDGMDGLRAWSAAFLPGAAGMLVDGPWYASAIAAYGYGYQHFNLDQGPIETPDQAVAETVLQGSAGYCNLDYFVGLTGYYGSLTSDAGRLGVFQTLSSVEAFYGRRF